MYKLKKRYEGHTVYTNGYAILLDTVRPHQVEILDLVEYFEKTAKKEKKSKDITSDKS